MVPTKSTPNLPFSAFGSLRVSHLHLCNGLCHDRRCPLTPLADVTENGRDPQRQRAKLTRINGRSNSNYHIFSKSRVVLKTRTRLIENGKYEDLHCVLRR